MLVLYGYFTATALFTMGMSASEGHQQIHLQGPVTIKAHQDQTSKGGSNLDEI